MHTLIKYIVYFLGGFILSGILSLLGAWWLIIFGPLVFALLLKMRVFPAFVLGFLTIVALWSVTMLYFTARGSGDMIQLMSRLLPVGGNSVILITITLIIGGLVGGLAAITGVYWRQVLFPAQTQIQ
jgi:hypothetical protein